MQRPRSAKEMGTPMEALEIIRRMAVRYGDDQIASVLNRRGYSTGKGKRWNQTRVATARRNHLSDPPPVFRRLSGVDDQARPPQAH
jgi:hypothetical protein